MDVVQHIINLKYEVTRRERGKGLACDVGGLCEREGKIDGAVAVEGREVLKWSSEPKA